MDLVIYDKTECRGYIAFDVDIPIGSVQLLSVTRHADKVVEDVIFLEGMNYGWVIPKDIADRLRDSNYGKVEVLK